MQDQFLYPVTVRNGDLDTSAPFNMEFKDGVGGGNVLPPPSARFPMTNTNGRGKQSQGIYFWNGRRWVFGLPYVELCQSIIGGGAVQIIHNLTGELDLDIPGTTHTVLYKNGVPQTDAVARGSQSTDLWVAVGYGSAATLGTVKSINGLRPDVAGNIALALGGLSDVDVTSATNKQILEYNETSKNWVPVDPPTGNVQTVSGQAPDANGNIPISVTNNNIATGLSLISNTGETTGNAKLKTLVAGALIVLSSDANGNVVIGSNATSGALTAVRSEGTGTALVDGDGTAGGIATIKSLAAGSNITITQNADGKTLTLAANQVLQPATTTAIGGVIVSTGLSVAANGALSLAAPVGVNIGGVKAGSGVSIAADGTLSVTAVGGVSSVSQQTGVVVISATDTSTASGTSLITGTGATTGTIVLRRIVAGTGIALATDANNNLQISASGGAGVTSIAADSGTPATGAISFVSGTSISLAQTGNQIQINGTGVPEAPNNDNVYARGQGTWVIVPNAASAITSVTGQTGTNAILLVEANPPANSAIIKSLVAGTNVTLSETGGLITINAALPAGTVGSINGVLPNSSGNVTLTASNVAALPLAGGTMTGAVNMGSNALTGLINPVNDSDAVNYATLKGLAIDGGVIG